MTFSVVEILAAASSSAGRKHTNKQIQPITMKQVRAFGC